MSPDTPVILPPSPKLLDYPATIGITFGILFTAILLYVAGKFDPTKGQLTISLLVVIAFLGVAIFSVFFTIPSNEITSAIIGGLVAAFGAVVAHWIGRSSGPFDKDKDKQ